jgi:hypothetical protein
MVLLIIIELTSHALRTQPSQHHLRGKESDIYNRHTMEPKRGNGFLHQPYANGNTVQMHSAEASVEQAGRKSTYTQM